MSQFRRNWKPSFQVPNRLILAATLSASARRMGAVLYSRRNRLGACRKSQSTLAALAGCSVTTARKALGELERAGYITKTRHYKYDETKGRLVYDQYTYHCDLGFHGGFTLVPRDLFGHTLISSAFVLCLYLYLRAGNRNRAFPSLNTICKDLWMGKATVCRALKALGAAGRIYAQHCLKTNRAFSKNSYIFLCNPDYAVAAHAAQDVPCVVPVMSLRPLSIPRAVVRRYKPTWAGAAPFPCSYYKPVKHRVQLFSHQGVVSKLSI